MVGGSVYFTPEIASETAPETTFKDGIEKRDSEIPRNSFSIYL